MNLMNVLTCRWDDRLLHACGGPELRAKIGPEPAPGGDYPSRYGNSSSTYAAAPGGNYPAAGYRAPSPRPGEVPRPVSPYRNPVAVPRPVSPYAAPVAPRPVSPY